MAKANRSSGIRRQQYQHCDYYVGTKDELVAARLAKREWFPTSSEPAPGGRRGNKRTFTIESELSRALEGAYRGRLLQVTLWRMRNDRWQLMLPASVEEQQKRAEEIARLQSDPWGERPRSASILRLVVDNTRGAS